MKKAITLLFILIVSFASAQKFSIEVGPGEYQALFINSDGKLYGLGNHGNAGTGGGRAAIPKQVITSPDDVKFKYAFGGLHGCAAIDENDNVWTMGDAAFGLSGTGSPAYSRFAQKILTDNLGKPFTGVKTMSSFFVQPYIGWYAIKKDGTLWVWGQPGPFRGNGTNVPDVLDRPTQIVMPGGRLVKQITGADYAIVLCTDGTVWTFGTMSPANLGYPMTGNQYLSPHKIAGLSDIAQIAGGKGFNYAVSKKNILFGWGEYGRYMCDQTYQEGTGPVYLIPKNLHTTVTSLLPSPIKKIVTNFLTTTVLLENGDLYSWGENSQGTVGNGQMYYGNTINGFGWDFQTHLMVKAPYHVAPGVKFSNVWGGHSWVFYTYALTTDNKLLAWGRNKSSVIANKIEGAGSGTIEAAYQNSWDIKWPTPVDPFTITTSYLATSEFCVINPIGSPCANYKLPLNSNPTASAGTAQSVTVPFAELDGSVSSDNVYIMLHEWTQVSGPNKAVIDLPASPTPTVRELIPGTYIFQHKVTDNGWLSDSATVKIINVKR